MSVPFILLGILALGLVVGNLARDKDGRDLIGGCLIWFLGLAALGWVLQSIGAAVFGSSV